MATIKYLANLDLSKNQILNAVVQNLAVAPSSPVQGQIYWSTADDTLYVWNEDGSAWIDLGSSGITNLDYTAAVSQGTVTSDTGTDAVIPLADGTNAGLFSAAEKTKLTNIEANAKDDQDSSEVALSTAVNGETTVQGSLEDHESRIDTLEGIDHAAVTLNADDATQETLNLVGQEIQVNLASTTTDGAMAAGDKSKLDGIEALADVTDATNVTAAGAVMDSELTSEASVKALDQGVATTDTPTFAGIITAGNVDGRDVSVDGAKLDGIEAGADVTDATNVDAAGAVMESDTTTASMSFVIDEDDMVSDLDTKVPTQQSVKKYVDDEIAAALSSEMSYQGAYDASTNPNSSANKGDTYTVSVAGTGVSSYWSTSLSIGDIIIAEIDNPSSEADWTEVNKNIPDIVNASTTATGIIELATQTEVNTGTDTTRAITPATLKGTLGITGTLSTTLKFSALIGDASATTFAVTHSIGSQHVTAQVVDATTGDQIICEIENTDANNTTFKFNVAPTSNEYRVIIIG